jgi:ubiquitin C-terminal hydrolase
MASILGGIWNKAKTLITSSSDDSSTNYFRNTAIAAAAGVGLAFFTGLNPLGIAGAAAVAAFTGTHAAEAFEAIEKTETAASEAVAAAAPAPARAVRQPPPPPPPRNDSPTKRFREKNNAKKTGIVKLNPIFKDINSIKNTITTQLKPNCKAETKLILTDEKIAEIAKRIFQKKDNQINQQDIDFQSIIQLNYYAPTAIVSLRKASPPPESPFSTLTEASSTDADSKSTAPITPSASSTQSISRENEVDIFGQKFYLTKWKIIKGNKTSVPITNDEEKKAWVDNIKALLTAKEIKDEASMTAKGVKNINLTFGLNEQNEFNFSKKANIRYTDKDGKEEVILKGEKIFSDEYLVLDESIKKALYSFISTSQAYKFNFASDKTTSSTSISKGIKGINNLKNNCFIIAALQSIVADKDLKAFFKNTANENQIKEDAEDIKVNKQLLFKAVNQFIEAYDKDGSEAIDGQLVQDIRTALKSLNPEIKNDNRGDAVDVIRLLKQLKDNKKIETETIWKSIITIPDSSDGSTKEISDKNAEPSLTLAPEYIQKIDITTLQKIYSGTLVTPVSSHSQPIDGIGQARIQTQKYIFDQIPNNLYVQVARLKFEPNKDPVKANKPITIETTLKDLTLFKDSNTKHNPTTYELQSIICYQGDGDKGHYYTLIKKGAQWYQLNDSKATPLDEAKALEFSSADAVYLSYTKEQTPA